MVYKKFENPEGNYIDSMNERWDILEAHEAWTPQGKNVGWEEFENLEKAAEAYELTYDPKPQELENAH